MPASLLWIPATIAAGIFQVGRNALQRGVMTTAGPWDATLVRFLIGLPFSLPFTAFAILVVPAAHPQFGADFWIGDHRRRVADPRDRRFARRDAPRRLRGRHRSAAEFAAARRDGRVDRLSRPAERDRLGRRDDHHDRPRRPDWPSKLSPMPRAASGAVFGIASGLLFGFSLNAFRHAALGLDAAHPVYAAIVSVSVVQAIQAAALTLR